MQKGFGRSPVALDPKAREAIVKRVLEEINNGVEDWSAFDSAVIKKISLLGWDSLKRIPGFNPGGTWRNDRGRFASQYPKDSVVHMRAMTDRLEVSHCRNFDGISI